MAEAIDQDNKTHLRGVIRGVDIELLTDTASALGRITNACRDARSSIWIAQLAFDADCTAMAPAHRSPETLLDVILRSAHGPQANGMGADVRILLNSSILLDTTPALRCAIRDSDSRANRGADAAAGRRLEIRGMDAFPQVMHAKMAVIDGCEAYLMGASFVHGYWDAGRHYPAGSADIPAGCGDRPMHDVAIRLTGGVAAELARWFCDTWVAAGGAPLTDTAPLRPLPVDTSTGRVRVGQSSVRVVRTTPAGMLGGVPAGETQILEEYLDAITEARSFIYMENQYFSARPIATALRDALQARRDLEVILLLNQNPDITGYRAWQDDRLATEGLLTHERVGVFAPWSVTPSLTAPESIELTQLFIHSKVAVIDDEWLTLGTANLDGASLHSYGDDFIHWP
ncbi:MAG: phospholipase D-like domain-containing protein, partial [Gemmatimonadaceae bacterium]